MSSLSPQVQKMLDAFSRKRDVTPEMVDNLRLALVASPLLVEQINQAIEEKHIKTFGLLDASFKAGATYDGQRKSINVSRTGLIPAEKDWQQSINDMTFVLGHEIQHGFNHAERQRANDEAVRQMDFIAKSKDPRNVYDDPVEYHIQASRSDEARAHIAGWNATLSQLARGDKQVTLDDIQTAIPGRAKDFLEKIQATNRYQPKPGLTFNADNSLSPTPGNIEMMGKYYYDNPENKIGHAESTYRNLDGANALSLAAEAQRRQAKPFRGQEPQFLVNMQSRGLEEGKLEINGINLGKDGPNIRVSRTTTPVRDKCGPDSWITQPKVTCLCRSLRRRLSHKKVVVRYSATLLIGTTRCTQS